MITARTAPCVGMVCWLGEALALYIMDVFLSCTLCDDVLLGGFPVYYEALR